MLTSGFNLDDLWDSNSLHDKLGLNIDEDPIAVDIKADMPTLEDDVDEGRRMEKVD
jgi:hypothetical protein